MMDLVENDLPSTSRCDEECPQMPPWSIHKRIKLGHEGGAGQRRSSKTKEKVEGVNDVAKCCCIDLQEEGTSLGEG